MERCPVMITKRVGDEIFDLCEENEMRLCDLWSVNICDTFEKIKKEWEDETQDNR